MRRRLRGKELDAFIDAFDRACIEFSETMRIACAYSRDVDDWNMRFVMFGEAWHRHGAALLDMVLEATGIDLRDRFDPPIGPAAGRPNQRG